VTGAHTGAGEAAADDRRMTLLGSFDALAAKSLDSSAVNCNYVLREGCWGVLAKT
jgi:hypothetical protein